MTSRSRSYNIHDPAERVDWLREMHDLALGVAEFGDPQERSERQLAVDRAYTKATAPCAPSREIVPGVVRKLAGVDVGSRYQIGTAEYGSADQAIAVVGTLCKLAIDALQSVVCAGADLADAVDASGLLSMTDPQNAARDARMHEALLHCLVNLNEYERLTRREEDENGCRPETTVNES